MSKQGSMSELQKCGVDPFAEHKRVKQKVKFPLNPAFFKTSVQDRKILQSMNAYVRTLKVPLNKNQNVEYMTERTMQQFEHYSSEIERIIKGHRDQEFQDSLVQFITNLSFSEMTEGEKELVFSSTLGTSLEGRYVRDILQDYLEHQLAEQSKQKRLLKRDDTLDRLERQRAVAATADAANNKDEVEDADAKQTLYD